MPVYEYKVVPAPTRGLKAKGVKGTPARFANALETVMNEMGADGWIYQRTDTLPVEERQGLTGKTTTFQNMLVFQRFAETEAPEVVDDVAALIEDQREAAEATTDAPVEDPSPAQDEALTDETATQTSDDDPTEAGLDRVAEALTPEGFSLPWKSRTRSAPQSKETAPAATEDQPI